MEVCWGGVSRGVMGGALGMVVTGLQYKCTPEKLSFATYLLRDKPKMYVPSTLL